MKWQRSGAAGLSGLTFMGLLVSAVVGPPGAVAAPACVVRPVLPHLVAFAHSVERREIPLSTTCRVNGPVKLGVFRGGTRVGSIVWPGNNEHLVVDGALGTMVLHQDRTPPGHYAVPSQPAGLGGVRTVSEGFTAKDATRATLVIGMIGGHRVAYGVTELFDNGWNKQEMTARLDVKRRGKWTLYRRFDSDAEVSEGFYGDYRVRLPQAAGVYRVDIRATRMRAKFISPGRSTVLAYRPVPRHVN